MKRQKQKSLTFQKPYRSFKYSLINTTGTISSKMGLTKNILTKDILLEEAQKQTGLTDFGNSFFQTPLSILIDSLNEEANLNFLGKKLLYSRLLQRAINRLKIQEDLEQYPEIQKKVIKKPLFVIGLPRSGTTFLFNLLSQDPNSRWLRLWELSMPSPSPNPESFDSDPRIAIEEQKILSVKSFAPNIDSAHYLNARGPEECNQLLENNFTSSLFFFLANVPSYYKWLQEQEELNQSYQYYKLQLQLLSWNFSDCHLLLKAPAHLAYFKEILTLFPDANIIQTHRDPLKVIPSLSSLSSAFRSIFSDYIEPELMGKQWLDSIEYSIEKSMKTRQLLNKESHFFDLNYIDFIENPLKKIKEIYNYFDYDFSPTVENNMKKYIENNKQHKHGVHRYSLEQFSLNCDVIQEKFQKYYTKFNIIREY